MRRSIWYCKGNATQPQPMSIVFKDANEVVKHPNHKRFCYVGYISMQIMVFQNPPWSTPWTTRWTPFHRYSQEIEIYFDRLDRHGWVIVYIYIHNLPLIQLGFPTFPSLSKPWQRSRQESFVGSLHKRSCATSPSIGAKRSTCCTSLRRTARLLSCQHRFQGIDEDSESMGYPAWLCQNVYWKCPSRNSELSDLKWWISIAIVKLC